MSKVTFRKFVPKDAIHFKKLNMEWLERYFVVEPIDAIVLSNPQTEIIDKGGVIFMALLEDQIIGTFAYIKKADGFFEFSKMAINPIHRGKGYGNSMMQFALRYAKQHHWKKVVLYSSTNLENAIYLYRKHGFIEVPLEKNLIYSRGNIKMEIGF